MEVESFCLVTDHQRPLLKTVTHYGMLQVVFRVRSVAYFTHEPIIYTPWKGELFPHHQLSSLSDVLYCSGETWYYIYTAKAPPRMK